MQNCSDLSDGKNNILLGSVNHYAWAEFVDRQNSRLIYNIRFVKSRLNVRAYYPLKFTKKKKKEKNASIFMTETLFYDKFPFHVLFLSTHDI